MPLIGGGLGGLIVPATADWLSVVKADSPVVFLVLDDASGTTAEDSSPNNRDGTYSGGFTLGATGPVAGAKATTFNGSTGKVAVASDAAFETAAMTIEAWVKPAWTGGGAPNNPCVAAYRNNTGARWSLHIGAGGGTYTDVGIYNGSAYVSVNNASMGLAKDTWAQLAVVLGGGTMEVFINGVSKGTASHTVGANTGKPFTVASNGNAGEWFNGSVHGVAYFGAALSSARIAAHYAARIGA